MVSVKQSKQGKNARVRTTAKADRDSGLFAAERKRNRTEAEVDDGYKLLAAEFISRQIKHLMDQLDGIRHQKDIEHIHQARVASRRLRAALRMFVNCFKVGISEKWRKEMRRLTRRLGEARDKDVQIDFLTNFIKTDRSKSHLPGLQRLILRFKDERRNCQKRVVKALDRLSNIRTLSEMYSETQTLMYDLRSRKVSVRSPAALMQAENYISESLNSLLSFEVSLSDPNASASHHEMRIAAKRLRYTCEICDPVFSDKLEPFTVAIKKMQTILGNMHDCDVWIEQLPIYLAREHQLTIEYFGHTRAMTRLKTGIFYLQLNRQKERKRLFREARQYWRDCRDQKMWEALAKLVQLLERRSLGKTKPLF